MSSLSRFFQRRRACAVEQTNGAATTPDQGAHRAASGQPEAGLAPAQHPEGAQDQVAARHAAGSELKR